MSWRHFCEIFFEHIKKMTSKRHHWLILMDHSLCKGLCSFPKVFFPKSLYQSMSNPKNYKNIFKAIFFWQKKKFVPGRETLIIGLKLTLIYLVKTNQNSKNDSLITNSCVRNLRVHRTEFLGHRNTKTVMQGHRMKNVYS